MLSKREVSVSVVVGVVALGVGYLAGTSTGSDRQPSAPNAPLKRLHPVQGPAQALDLMPAAELPGLAELRRPANRGAASGHGSPQAPPVAGGGQPAPTPQPTRPPAPHPASGDGGGGGEV